LISILGLVVDPATITRVVTDVVSQLGPSSAVDTFKGPIEQISGNRSTALFGLIFGVAVAIWTASNYVGAFMRASNAVYEREEGRPFYLLKPLQLIVTLGLVLMAALVVLSLIVTGPVAKAIGDAVGLGDAAVTAWNIAKWPVMLVVVMLMLAILYWSAPNAKPAGFRWISPGSVVAVILWIIASAAFAFYVANFGSYNKTYGALAGVIVFLVWMWITNIAVLMGAELNAETERARELEAGVPGAEEEIQAPYRREPKDEPEKAGRT
jgi:membrane protein